MQQENVENVNAFSRPKKEREREKKKTDKNDLSVCPMMNDRTSPINSCPLIPALPPSSNCYTHVEIRTRSVRGRGNMIQNKTKKQIRPGGRKAGRESNASFIIKVV
jgi:hypothetical protein